LSIYYILADDPLNDSCPRAIIMSFERIFIRRKCCIQCYLFM